MLAAESFPRFELRMSGADIIAQSASWLRVSASVVPRSPPMMKSASFQLPGFWKRPSGRLYS